MQKKHKASSFSGPQIFSKSKTGMLWIFLPVSPYPLRAAPPSAAPDMILKPDV